MIVPHRLQIRVYYEDTDFSGYVYHANYLRFLERGRTEFLRALGVTQSVLQVEADGLVFVVARLSIDYLRPGKMDDLLDIETSVGMARGALIRMKQVARRGDEALVSADVTVVAIRDGRPVRLPAALKSIFDAAARNAVAKTD